MYKKHKIKNKNIGHHVNLLSGNFKVLMGVGWGNDAYSTTVKGFYM